MQGCVSQGPNLVCDEFVAGIIGMETVNRDQSLTVRILGAVRAVIGLVDLRLKRRWPPP